MVGWLDSVDDGHGLARGFVIRGHESVGVSHHNTNEKQGHKAGHNCQH